MSNQYQEPTPLLCKCDNGCSQTKHGTRIFDETVEYDFLTQQAGATAVDIPNPTTLIELIGEGAAAVLDSNISRPISMTDDVFNQIASRVETGKPKNPWDGKWKGGKSPCN